MTPHSVPNARIWPSGANGVGELLPKLGRTGLQIQIPLGRDNTKRIGGGVRQGNGLANEVRVSAALK